MPLLVNHLNNHLQIQCLKTRIEIDPLGEINVLPFPVDRVIQDFFLRSNAPQDISRDVKF